MSEDAEVSEGNEMNGNDMQDGHLKSEKGSAGTLYKQEKWFVSAKRADFNAWGQKFGISPILARIIRNRDVAEEKDVGKYLYLDSGTLTPLLKRLEEKGYIKRQRSPEDERDLIVTITKSGEDLKKKAVKIPEKLGACVDIDAEKAQALYSILYEIIGKLNDPDK